MPSLFTKEFALERIRMILDDDKNYQTDELKLGGIWGWCTEVLDYERRETCIEVKEY